jgi:hypothetical protein
VLAGALATGCVENDQSLFITRFVPADPTMMCAGTASGTVGQSQGTLDVGIVGFGYRGFVANIEVQNNLPSRMIGVTGIEANGVQLTGFDVELVPPPSLASFLPSSQRKFTLPSAGGRIAPAGGQVVVPAEILPAQVALLLAPGLTSAPSLPVVLASIKPLGDHSGDTLTGPAVEFPIEVCKFCLTPPPQSCPATGFKMTDVILGNQCYPEQDGSVTCCLNAAMQLLCGSHVPMSM